MNLKTLLVAGVIAIASPIAAAAATLVPGGTINNLSNAPLDFNQDFDINTTAGSLNFTIRNDTAFAQVFSVAGGTVQQQSATFDGDTVLAWATGDSDTVAGGAGILTGLGPILTVIAAGTSEILTLTYTTVTDIEGDIGIGKTNVDFTVTATPVPVPAGILLMGTALAGFGVMRRRKKKAA